MRMTIDGVNLPVRKTTGSCGYDIYCPFDLNLFNYCFVTIDTGILMEPGDIPDGYCALIVPRSSMGMKYGLRLANSVGVIDSDYTMDTIKASLKIEHPLSHISFKKNERILQMILVPFGVIPDEEEPREARKGGVGSTGA